MTSHRLLAIVLVLGAMFAAPSPSPASADDPPNIAGTWTWTWKDAQGEPHRHVLEVEGVGDKLAARERFDDKEAIKVDDLKLEGKTISFVVNREKRRARYKGTVASAETINGMVSIAIEGQESEFGWTATREAGKK